VAEFERYNSSSMPFKFVESNSFYIHIFIHFDIYEKNSVFPVF
jgi:hypothetical protein